MHKFSALRLNAVALPEFTKMSIKIYLNFDKPTISKGILDLLSNGLVEDPYRDALKTSLKESLAILAKGNKLQYGPANNLLASILQTLALEDSDIADEITTVPIPASQDEHLPQSPTQGPSSGSRSDIPKKDHKETDLKKKTNELCRFFARGKCNRSKDCRFNHPNICKKFRQFGSVSTDSKGCDGKCNAFHPNACRNSLRNKSCSFSECRFYHLKGTKTTGRDSSGLSQNQNPKQNSNQNYNQNQNSTRNKNSRPNQHQPGKHQYNQNQNHSQSRTKFESSKKVNSPTDAKSGSVFQQEQPALAAMLEAIMKRLSVMETCQSMMPQLLTPAHYITPLLSPAVPQPGSQTQQQWASPNQWTQSQY